jgi:hypothetical protein
MLSYVCSGNNPPAVLDWLPAAAAQVPPPSPDGVAPGGPPVPGPPSGRPTKKAA